ncbi:hypothetical protein [Sphingorhabdus contaminans]|uniref:Uncharacterized protein n=1 Tax=Sphingorhabdus contaminans TaxID=1343899 RepID=A0A553WCU9_9SPHN|nr:hypothetical protein [Sphingorhabdus contaminans]TSB02513.1 hypothetical protein FOM92_15640 [Sphingorhabdus contaminans]
MRMNAHCLSKDLRWQRRYFFSWIALVFFGCAAFAMGEEGTLAITAQALFFLAAFAVIIWPLCAAFQVECDRYGNPKQGRNP